MFGIKNRIATQDIWKRSMSSDVWRTNVGYFNKEKSLQVVKENSLLVFEASGKLRLAGASYSQG